LVQHANQFEFLHAARIRYARYMGRNVVMPGDKEVRLDTLLEVHEAIVNEVTEASEDSGNSIDI